MRISDWSSDVCSSDLPTPPGAPVSGLLQRAIALMVIANKVVPPMRILAGLMTILLTSLLAACALSGGSSIPAPDPVQASVAASHIAVDARVQAAVLRTPDLGFTVPARPDGAICVPPVRDAMSCGAHPPQ